MDYKKFSFRELDSTNSQAVRMIEAGEKGAFWVYAYKQTCGKGRRGRGWVSQDGNLFTTVAVPQGSLFPNLTQLSFVASLAIYDVISSYKESNDIDIKIKWPNDIFVNGYKVCGILLEVISNNPRFVIIGYGVNVARSPELCQEYSASNLYDTMGVVINVEEILSMLIQQFTKWYYLWNSGENFPKILETWKKRTNLIDRLITVRLNNKPDIIGKVNDINKDGALLLELEDGTNKLVFAGDIFIN